MDTPPGDQDAFGIAEVTADTGTSTVCFEVETDGLMAPITGHLHEGTTLNDPGPEVLTLYTDSADADPSGCIDADPALVAGMVDRSILTFLEVHTPDFPDGALAGGLSVGIHTFVLTADAVVPGPGDTDAAVMALVAPSTKGRSVLISIQSARLETPMTVELFRGAPGSDGVLVKSLFAPTNDPSPGEIFSFDNHLGREFVNSPESFYIEIRNAAFPDGAIRGQVED